ncbi:class I SAM-dependent methyltransferase [Aquiflexum sp. TKW24L]|uniref:class I SAM-dependent methyltransferase n=1 Tax=Aquiflexum sp. TKW24L TaxID=2942212 RepID=UPI0020BD6FBC|nr:class I SAM-dependent methyltransferase [Aquiflexum sp. TKW24L]MCL6258963.1 class I SAM-dependent methyltransferase [Aquiflexum sp. TKW24L]
MRNKSVNTWKHFGKEDPYYGVLSDQKYKSENLTSEGLTEFFATGEVYVAETLQKIKQLYNSDLSNSAILDFGCGVGRLAIPFSFVTKNKTMGIDVSQDILEKAKNHAVEMGAENVEFLLSEGKALPDTDKFDFINSYIVLQHIETKTGLAIIQQLLDKLEIGGVMQIQATYGNNWPKIKYYHYYLRANYSLYNFVYSSLKNRKLEAEPMMQMNSYDPKILFGLFSKYSNSIHVELTDHTGFLGASYLFKREF